MNNNNSYIKETDMESAVVAIAEDDGQLKAVVLRKKDGVFELVGMSSTDSAETTWQGFATEFIGQAEGEGDIKLVIGYGCECMIFYHIDIPEVKEEELADLIRLQAEARFPLPIGQMAFAWQTGVKYGGQLPVTIAAARKEQLQEFVGRVRALKPAKIILNCEGIAKSWQEFFSVGKEDGLVLNIGEHSTEVCQVEGGRLTNAASVDIGTDDFSAGAAGTADRFGQDIKNALEKFGFSDGDNVGIYVLSDGRSEIEDMALCLGSAGLNVQTVRPKVEELSGNDEIGVSEVYEYRAALGLAAMSFEPADKDINIFEGLYHRGGKVKSRLCSVRMAMVIAATMFIFLIIVCYFVDSGRLKCVEKRFNSAEASENCGVLLERQKLLREVSIRRPDLLELLSRINSVENSGVLLDGFHCKKGQPITISGEVKSDDQLYKFQENLLSKKGVSKVKIQRVKKVSGNKLSFSIVFNYKNFTKKK